MGSLIAFLLIYLVFRTIDLSINSQKKAVKKNKTFKELAAEISREMEGESAIGIKEAFMGIEEVEEPVEATDSEEPVVSSDRNIRMNRGESSLEGNSLEGNSLEGQGLEDLDKKLLTSGFIRTMKDINAKAVAESENNDGLGQKIEPGSMNLKMENLSPKDLAMGVIYQEILSKPVSLR